jgi:hypothetical protein
MELVKYRIPTEVRKALKGKPTKVRIETLFHAIAPYYLEAMKAASAEAAEQKGLDWLERLFRLEDPRG